MSLTADGVFQKIMEKAMEDAQPGSSKKPYFQFLSRNF